MRPANSRFIRIIREDGREVVNIDVAISPSVIYPEGSLRRELRFTTNYQFAERMQYYVLLDPGICNVDCSLSNVLAVEYVSIEVHA